MKYHREMNGALFTVDPKSGRIEDVYIIASNDQAGSIVCGAMARITKHYHWVWIRKLIGKRRYRF